MKNPSLLSLIPLLLLLLAVSLPAASAAVRTRRFRSRRMRSSYSHVEYCLGNGGICSHVRCLGDGVYVANSTYQANLRRAAALLVDDASAARGGGANYTSRSVGNGAAGKESL